MDGSRTSLEWSPEDNATSNYSWTVNSSSLGRRPQARPAWIPSAETSPSRRPRSHSATGEFACAAGLRSVRRPGDSMEEDGRPEMENEEDRLELEW